MFWLYEALFGMKLIFEKAFVLVNIYSHIKTETDLHNYEQ